MFDYIIIGGGSAGCVLANRLSANPNNTVCLLEAGVSGGAKRHKYLIKAPIGIGLLMWHPTLNWGFHSQPEPQLNNRTLYSPRGKVLGGSSAINAMVYIRGQKEDYDAWAAAGNTGWGWDTLLPLFKRQENQLRTADNLCGTALHNSDLHGTGGPVCIDDPNHVDALSRTFISAGEELGYRNNPDFNGLNQEGFGYFQLNQLNGERWSASRAFLDPIKHRKNLTILTEAHAAKLLIEDHKAIGVEYLKSNSINRIHSKKETILCGGTFASPQLLMLSGIGPKEELAKHDIPLIHPLEGVGKNLQDHLDIILRHKNKQPAGFGLSARFALKAAKAPFQYLKNRNGFFSSNTSEVGAFIKSDAEMDRPDIQMHFTPMYIKKHGRSKPPLGHAYSLHLCNLRPKSRGEILLNSANASDAPKIHYHFLENEEDLKAMIKAVKLGREILETHAFSDYRKKELAPGEDKQSDAEIAEFIREEAESIYHPVGTCKMGNDPLAVVDEQLRVSGIQGLRVADASIMPSLISGNTNATSMVIAERAAELILQNDQR
ncbi:MAG: choline dehydrogenase [Pseudomonadales bacterium]|nr:choline dehydrogenase [Pseudomonadales bacterium]